MTSLFDMSKVGISSSSSRAVGSTETDKQFIDDLVEKGLLGSVTCVAVDVYGSLSLTGGGHHIDITIVMGLAGNEPATMDIDNIPGFIRDVETRGCLLLAQGRHEMNLPQNDGVRSRNGDLPLYENGVQIHAYNGETVIYSKTYYPIDGGLIIDEGYFGQDATGEISVPYSFKSTTGMLECCNSAGPSLSDMAMQSELALHNKKEIEGYLNHVWQTIQACIDRDMNIEGVLPGPLCVPRRTLALRRALISSDKLSNDPMSVIDWVSIFTLAVNEENAAGGHAVTVPTNDACGIMPMILAYYDHFTESISPDTCTRYFLAADAIGALYKMSTSISGTEVGCQDEVGVACSMAATGLAELPGTSPEQVCVTVEIGMKHNFGLTCDPVTGQVQVPYIECNVIASAKATNAARVATRRISAPRVSLDKIIETTYEINKDMNAKCCETSCGGLAIEVQRG